MPFVIDASVAVCWLMPDECDERADRAFDLLDTETALAPGLWWYEVRNVFIIVERRGRLDAGQVKRALALLSALPIQLDHSADEAAVLDLARRYRLSVYDSAYLELAKRHGASLATLDSDLERAARAEGVPLVTGPIQQT